MYTDFVARFFRPFTSCPQPAVLGLALFTFPAYTAADVSSDPRQQSRCEALYPEVSHRPSEVIVGSDIKDLASFRASDAGFSGEYRVELGGATITVSVSDDALTRTFQQPGTEPDQRTFKPVCLSGSEMVTDSMVARRVSEGLLYLEPSSNIGELPADLWILLDVQ